MARAVVVGLSLGLAASLAVNAWLLARRRAPAASETAAAPAAGTAAATETDAATETATVATSATAPAPGDLAICRRELADLRVKLWEHLPLPERFAAGAPSPEAEARVRPGVDSALAGLAVDWQLECRGRVCHLQIVQPATPVDGDGGAPDDWMGAIQAAGGVRALAHGMAFQSPRPATDPVSGQGTLVHDSWIALAPDGDAQAGMRLLQALWQAFLDGLHATCGKRVAAGKTVALDVRLDVNAEAAGVRVHVGGDRDPDGVHDCVVNALEALAAGMPAPPELPGAVLHQRVELP